MGTPTVFVCTADNTFGGKTWVRGQLFDGSLDEAPVSAMGWAQRSLRPDEAAPILETMSSGHSRTNWSHGPPMPPEPGPVISGYDLKRGEPIIDERATRNAEQARIDRALYWLPKPSNETTFKRQLAYLKQAAPEQYQSWVADHPQDAIPDGWVSPAPEIAPMMDITPVLMMAAPPAPVDSPAEASAAPLEDLDGLLAEEERIEASGDEERLAEIRWQIDATMR